MKVKDLIVVSILSLFTASCHQIDGINTRLNIRTAEYLNPDNRGKASPIVLSVYELKDQKRFAQLSYRELTTNPNNTLKTSLIDIHTIEIRPNIHQELTLYINKNTRYLGVIAGYRSIDSSKWKQVITMSNHPRHLKMDVMLQTNNMRISHIG